jgi:hypothetical protein
VQRGVARFEQLLQAAQQEGAGEGGQQQQEGKQQGQQGPPDCSGGMPGAGQAQPAGTASDMCTSQRQESPAMQASPSSEHASQSAATAAAGAAADGSRAGVPWQHILDDIMGCTQGITDPGLLPDTGCPVEVEQLLSPTFVKECSLMGQQYGTRSQTVLGVWRDGHAELRERYRADNGTWQMVQHAFEFEV